MERLRALIVITLILISPLFTSASAKESVMHPNIIRVMNNTDSNTDIGFIVQYRPHLTEEHLATAEGIGIEIISVFEFIDGFYGKGDSEQIKFLSRQ
ncbi:MAG: hypothetical protein VX188_00565, partial [Candidatus Thermoplasmatota archaeon]|nr:hypothetical protein [Candidatus Thermoplasmatota archaeon]